MGHIRTPQADSDLDDIWFYVATKSGSLDIADRFIDSITDRFFLLASHPNIGRTRDEDLRPGLRSFPVGEYVIIYRVQGQEVLILRVVRAAAGTLKPYSAVDPRKGRAVSARAGVARHRFQHPSPITQHPL